MNTLDLETHPELQSLMASLEQEVLVIRVGGKPVAYLEKAKPSSLFSFRSNMKTPIYAGNSVVKMRREDDRGSMLYLDASVLVACYIPEQRSAEAEALVLAEPECLASDLTIAEVKNAIIRRGKRGAVLPEDVEMALAQIDEHMENGGYRPVILGRTTFGESVALARRSPMHLRTADALHLAIVLRVGCPLATFDVVLAAAAKAEGVDVIAGLVLHKGWRVRKNRDTQPLVTVNSALILLRG